LVITCLFLCTRALFADSTALTGKEIALMLRAGYSSQALLEDLKTRHFAETLSPELEEELKKANASPALIEALKRSENQASEREKVARQQFAEAQALEAKRISKETVARQPRPQQERKIVVVPAQTEPNFKTPSEIAREQEAANAAKIAARKAYCEAHPVECETLAAAQAAREAAESLRYGPR
jgi:Xaa-Pro aminopeptidase